MNYISKKLKYAKLFCTFLFVITPISNQIFAQKIVNDSVEINQITKKENTSTRVNLKNINYGTRFVFHFGNSNSKTNSVSKNNAKKNTVTEETIQINTNQLANKKLPYKN